jgi:2'-5' RNA ligase
MPRIFIAAPVSPEVQASIAALPHPAGTPLRWVRADQLHITLRFLGEISDEQLDQVLGATRDAAAGNPGTLRLTARGIGAFPDEHRARIVWVGIAGQVAGLKALQRSLENQLAARGFRRDERSFTPHITIARLRKPGPLPVELQAFAVRDFGSWQLNALQLIESRLSPAGAQYLLRHEVPLEPYADG